MKAIVIGDIHFVDKIPLRRNDDVLVTQFQKLEALKKIVIDTQPLDGIFLLGDVFDKHSPDIWLVNRVIRAFKEIRSCISGRDIPIYSIVGNHCVHGRVESVQDAALGTLFSSGVVQRITGDLKIAGVDFRALDYTTNHSVEMYKVSTPHIILTHNMITPNPVLFEHIVVEDIAKSISNCVIFAGHYHSPFTYVSPTDTYIINPGVVVRTDIGERNIDPSVILFSYELGKFRFKKISLGMGYKDGKLNGVFNMEEYEKEKASELNLQQFINSIKNTQFQGQDLESLVRSVGEEQKLDPPIVTEAIRRITQAKALI